MLSGIYNKNIVYIIIIYKSVQYILYIGKFYSKMYVCINMCMGIQSLKEE